MQALLIQCSCTTSKGTHGKILQNSAKHALCSQVDTEGDVVWGILQETYRGAVSNLTGARGKGEKVRGKAQGKHAVTN